ncbi:MAG: aldo/keto reductase, partial [Stackebrandtia sp.]
DTYLERGGNFIDTASAYTDGTSEEFVGDFAHGRRDELVIATKNSMTIRPGDPNAGGNGRKSLRQSVEQSLRRLRTDYIDLLYLHAWDFTTSAEEVLRGLDDLVGAGKVLYLGLPDIPAWQAARMQTTAELRGWEPLVALQIQYSLLERTVERDLIPMAAELGMGVVPWSPLGSGVLTGKYTRADLDEEASDNPVGSRRNVARANGALTPRALDIADVVGHVAKEMGVAPAQVAVAWTLLNQAVTSPIVGARTLQQLESNLGALDVGFTTDQRRRLDAASGIELGFPHDFLAGGLVSAVLHGGATIVHR